MHEADEALKKIDMTKWQCLLTPAEARTIIQHLGESAITRLKEMPCTELIIGAICAIGRVSNPPLPLPTHGFKPPSSTIFQKDEREVSLTPGLVFKMANVREQAHDIIEHAAFLMHYSEEMITRERVDLLPEFHRLKLELNSVMNRTPSQRVTAADTVGTAHTHTKEGQMGLGG